MENEDRFFCVSNLRGDEIVNCIDLIHMIDDKQGQDQDHKKAKDQIK